MVSFEMNDRKKIGLGLTGFGIFFSFLGIIFFFDKGLLAMGNILFLSGVMLTIGLKSSMQFFMKRSNYKVADGVFCAVASGQHWWFFCRRYLFSAGCSNSHILDHFLIGTVAKECLYEPYNFRIGYMKVQGSCLVELRLQML